MDLNQKYNQGADGLSQLGTRYLSESQRQTEGFGPSVTHSWPTLAKMRKKCFYGQENLGQYVAFCLRLQLPSQTQPTSTLSRIKCERYILIKKCVRSFIEVVIIVDYVSASICICTRICIMSIQHIHIWYLWPVRARMAWFRTWIKPRRSRKRPMLTHQEYKKWKAEINLEKKKKKQERRRTNETWKERRKMAR